jgi:hypothetical protein
MKPFFFLLMWLVAQTVHAQNITIDYDRLGLLIGGQQTHLLDKQFSPLIYSANEISLRLYYDAKHQKSSWNASLDIASGSLFPRQYADRKVYNTTEDIEGNVTTDSFFVQGNTRTVNLQLGYAHDLIQSGHWTLNLGANVRNQLMYPTTFVNLGIMNAASFVVTTRATWYLNAENEFSLGVGIPVIGFNTRFPYSGTVSRPNQTLVEAFFDGGTHFVSFGDYNQVNVNCGYRFALSPKTGIGLQYDFMWQQYTIPATLKQYTSRIGATIDINF